MLLNILICDDDEKYVDTISQSFHNYCLDNCLQYKVDKFTDGEEAMATQERYNIAFLDIEIGNINGLDIAKSLKKRNKNIIIFFITAYEKYIDDVMDLFAIRYIKKPFDQKRLYSGLDRAISLINDDEISFYLKNSSEVVKIRANEVLCVEIYHRNTLVFTTDNTYTSHENIDFWENSLCKVCFSRPHKSFIVNMEFIDNYKRNEVTLSNGKIVPVAYSKQKDFRKIFMDYLERRK